MFSSTLTNVDSITNLLCCWLSRYVTEEGFTWLEEKRQQIARGATERVFFTAFSAVPRYTGKKDLQLTAEDVQTAVDIRSGWYPKYWTVDQVGRTILLLALPHDHVATYVRSLEQICTTADVGELVTIYQSLPLLPHPELHRKWAAEGIRSNMTAVFNAVALHNPYPADYFDPPAWNQMVLKALFIGSPLHLIWGLDRRANAELARMLIDYAHERWAAKRPVHPQLWRLVGPFADTAIAADLEKVLNQPNIIEQKAAALACSQSTLPQAQALLASRPDLRSLIEEGGLTWTSFSENHLATC
ncbi:EboA family metabolite traffic protein [Anabaena azotica]|uniref:EboA family metabolite traffic protein n=1 Tax=Anabaena azotica FACHB-119 TaxID=947527 RepID=A0ABR8D7J4_9NOST|nr:EboA family metabolite traffic protein [Anabaena azotica]MBD2502101.1 EboA family metabolite traffic protein [Anabaena azotica FACHB-119]